MTTALEEIHRGTHRPYPCGAGAGYFGVSASGGPFPCHRFVQGDARAMGNVSDGVDRERQRLWLAERPLDRQDPCRSCWARYLCSGGCYPRMARLCARSLCQALGAETRLSSPMGLCAEQPLGRRERDARGVAR
jgi:radical SAM protein with 4Fe4S-binding SPASM domain